MVCDLFMPFDPLEEIARLSQQTNYLVIGLNQELRKVADMNSRETTRGRRKERPLVYVSQYFREHIPQNSPDRRMLEDLRRGRKLLEIVMNSGGSAASWTIKLIDDITRVYTTIYPGRDVEKDYKQYIDELSEASARKT